MATFTAVSHEALAGFLAGYGLTLETFGGIAQGSVNSNYWLDVSGKGRVFLRIFEEQGAEGARAEADLLDRLAAFGVPTPPPLRNREGEAVGTLADKPAALFPWRAGTMRCTKAVGERDTFQLGGALARLHLVPGDVPAMRRGPGRFRAPDLEARLDAIAQADDASLRALVEPLRRDLRAVEAARAGLPAGVIHGDLFRDNVLWSEANELVALLDFESAFEGPYVYDVAVCLLSWCYGEDFDETLMRALVRGYESIRPLSAPERAGLFEELRFGALRFTVTRITDFAMRRPQPAVMKDYRRFARRFERVTEMGSQTLARVLFSSP